jgi:hypothetical protein
MRGKSSAKKRRQNIGMKFDKFRILEPLFMGFSETFDELRAAPASRQGSPTRPAAPHLQNRPPVQFVPTDATAGELFRPNLRQQSPGSP